MKYPQREYELCVDVGSNGIQSTIVVSRDERLIHAPLDLGIKCLESYGCDLMPLSLNARSRMEQGKKAFITHTGNVVKEAVIYRPHQRSRLVRKSPILDSALLKKAIRDIRIKYF